MLMNVRLLSNTLLFHFLFLLELSYKIFNWQMANNFNEYLMKRCVMEMPTMTICIESSVAFFLSKKNQINTKVKSNHAHLSRATLNAHLH